MSEGALTDLLGGHATEHGVPGAALGVLRGVERATAYVGVADIRTGRPVSSVTRFGIGSLTKSMVASAVTVLADRHRLSLDDPIASRVPELAPCDWAHAETLRDLMANRSSIPLLASLEFGFDEHDGTDDLALSRLLGAVAAEAPSRDHWSYANVGWCALGRAIETTSGSTWEEAMPALLEDAGLSGTSWTEAETVDHAVGHDASRAGPVAVEPLWSRAYSPAGTTVASTVDDLLGYAAWHLSDPRPASMRVVHTETCIPGWFDAWGLGLARFDWHGSEVWGWDGVVNGQRSVLRLLPDQDGAVVVLTNGSSGRALAQGVLSDLVPGWFGVDLPARRLDPSVDAPTDLAPYAGTYGWPDRRVVVADCGAELGVTEDGVTRPAVPIDQRAFLVDPDDPDTPTIAFADFDAAGRPGVLYDMVWGLGRLSDD